MTVLFDSLGKSERPVIQFGYMSYRWTRILFSTLEHYISIHAQLSLTPPLQCASEPLPLHLYAIITCLLLKHLGMANLLLSVPINGLPMDNTTSPMGSFGKLPPDVLRFYVWDQLMPQHRSASRASTRLPADMSAARNHILPKDSRKFFNLGSEEKHTAP